MPFRIAPSSTPPKNSPPMFETGVPSRTQPARDLKDRRPPTLPIVGCNALPHCTTPLPPNPPPRSLPTQPTPDPPHPLTHERAKSSAAVPCPPSLTRNQAQGDVVPRHPPTRGPVPWTANVEAALNLMGEAFRTLFP